MAEGEQQQQEQHSLPAPNRFITDHDAQGLAVFSTRLAPPLPAQTIENGDKFYLGYATTSYPADTRGAADVAVYEGFLARPPGVVVPGGTTLRIADLRPGGESPMHRTVSLDYGVVLEGEVELVLDSGEARRLRRGDVCVQRGTNHVWRNASATAWARMLYVLQEATPVEVGGRTLGEDYGVGMGDVRPSGS